MINLYICLCIQHVNNALARQCLPARDPEVPRPQLFVLTSVDHWMARKRNVTGSLHISNYDWIGKYWD